MSLATEQLKQSQLDANQVIQANLVSDDDQGQVINEKLIRCNNFKAGRYGHIPVCYTENSPKEELVLEHVIQYQKQFKFAYDVDRDLLLYPKNECDVYKFICTTIRPQKMGYLELYDYQKAVKFISTFIQYEELDPPNQYPEVMPSPTNVMKWQKGDCFDMSILLASILIGAGYDAYVVFGTADRLLTTKNESYMEYEPMETEGLDGLDEELKQVKVVKKESEFGLNKKAPIISQYDKKKVEEKQAREEEEKRKAITIDDEEPDKLFKDPYDGIRKHAWVLIRKGKRGVEKNLFLEPSTGRIYDTDSHYYQTIDCTFNNRNFWINLKPQIEAKEVSFENLDGSPQWEYVMLDTLTFGTYIAENDEEGGEEGAQQHVQMTDEEKELQEIQQVLDMPAPWPPKIILEYEAYHRGSLLGENCQYYKRCKVEVYAEYSQVDGLVKRITIFEDFRRLKIKEIRYLFKHRVDRLKVRRRFPFIYTTVEYFDPNVPHNWKKITEVDRESREIIFYKNRNEDGLVKRIELVGAKTMEFYEDRDDRVVYRSIRFEKGEENRSNFPFKDNHVGNVIITKLTQRFDKNPSIRPSEQPAKMVVNIKKNYVKVYYHMEEGQIAPLIAEYPRDQIQVHAKLNEGEKKIHDAKKQLEYKRVHDLEKEGVNEMRSQEEIAEREQDKRSDIEEKINRYRKSNALEEANRDILEKSIQDKAREKYKYASKKKDEEADQDAYTKDYLYPYLAKRDLLGTSKFNYQQAIDIKNEVMNKLKERILARAEIIQKRLEEERENLAREEREATKRMQAKPEQAQQDKDFDEKIEKLQFRILILDQRASKFEIQALQDYQNMDKKINDDNRFDVLRNKK